MQDKIKYNAYTFHLEVNRRKDRQDWDNVFGSVSGPFRRDTYEEAYEAAVESIDEVAMWGKNYLKNVVELPCIFQDANYGVINDAEGVVFLSNVTWYEKRYGHADNDDIYVGIVIFPDVNHTRGLELMIQGSVEIKSGGRLRLADCAVTCLINYNYQDIYEQAKAVELEHDAITKQKYGKNASNPYLKEMKESFKEALATCRKEYKKEHTKGHNTGLYWFANSLNRQNKPITFTSYIPVAYDGPVLFEW